MSEFVALIEAQITPPTVIDEVGTGALIEPSTELRYLIMRCNDPSGALRHLHVAWPFAFKRVRHAIRADNRAEMLLDALRMKLRASNLLFDWYNLTNDDLLYVEGINEHNYIQFIRKVEEEDLGASAKDVTRRKTQPKEDKQEAPVMSVDEVEELRARLLAQANES